MSGCSNGTEGWILDETTFASACRKAKPLETFGIPLPVMLKPYATACLTGRKV